MASRKADGDKRRGIQSVEIGLRVLSVVASRTEASTLSAISQGSGLSASQTHRYLASLMASGMVKQVGPPGLYDLDFGAIKIGLAALARLDAFSLADRSFRELSQKTKRTCLVAVWGDDGPVIVRWFPGSPAVVTALSIGSALPVLQSATGRVFYAFGDSSATGEAARREAKRLGLKIAEIEAIRTECIADMSAQVQGDLIPGLRAVAAPVFDLQGRLALVATLIANANFLDTQDLEAKQELIAACRALSESLGGTWPR
jgi:DNA-binding IclR family transcriptional regulator